jgi:hypothetical protein
MKDLTDAERLTVQRLTDEHAKTLTEHKAKPTDKDFGQAERMEASFSDLRRLTVRHSVADSIKKFVLKRNMEAQKKKEKAKQTDNTSMPFWY